MYRACCSSSTLMQLCLEKCLMCFLCCAKDLSKLNVAALTPLSPEVISRQATINIGKLCPMTSSLAHNAVCMQIFMSNI